MENLEHRGSVDPVPNTVDINVLNKRIEEQERELFGDIPTIDTQDSQNPLLRFIGDKLATKLIPATAAISLVACACGDGKSGVDVNFVTQEPGHSVVIDNSTATHTTETATPPPDTTQDGKGDGATSTPRPTETANSTTEPKEESLPIYEREDYPYKLAEVKEYQGSEVKFVFGIEQAAYDRPEDNVCAKIANFSNETAPCPPIRRFELSDEYLKKYAPTEFPNGMSEEEMIQRMNDFILKGFVWNLQQKGMYKDLTVDTLKKMIHEGNAPVYAQSFANGDSIQWDLNNLEIHFILTDKSSFGDSGIKTPHTGETIKYQKVENAGVIGIWHWESFLLDYDKVYGGNFHKHSYAPALGLIDVFAMMSYDLFPLGKIDHTFLEDNIMPVIDLQNSNLSSIIVVSK